MKSLAFSVILTTLFLSSALNADVLVRIDEQGRSVFYNVPQKSPELAFAKNVKIVPAKYSNRMTEYVPLIEKACEKYSVDPELVKAVIQVESAYNPAAKSRAGAIGLMQLMPGTAERFGVKEIYDPNQNVHGGVQYLKFLLDLFRNDLTLAVAAYNAGEGAVQRFQGIPRYTETQNYVKKVLGLYGKETPSAPPVPKTIYKYVDAKGTVTFTTERLPGSVAIAR